MYVYSVSSGDLSGVTDSKLFFLLLQVLEGTLSDTRVYEPQPRARLGTNAQLLNTLERREGHSHRPSKCGVSNTPPVVKRPDLAAFKVIPKRFQRDWRSRSAGRGTAPLHTVPITALCVKSEESLDVTAVKPLGRLQGVAYRIAYRRALCPYGIAYPMVTCPCSIAYLRALCPYGIAYSRVLCPYGIA